MSRRPARFTEAQLREALGQAKLLDKPAMVVIAPDGTISVAPVPPPAEPAPEVTFVYFVQATESRRIKIGFTARLGKRLLAISTYCPEPVQVIGIMHGTIQDELALHERFKSCRIRGEWFAETPELTDYIQVHAQDIRP